MPVLSLQSLCVEKGTLYTKHGMVSRKHGNVLACATSKDNCECGKKQWPQSHCERCQKSFAALWPSEGPARRSRRASPSEDGGLLLVRLSFANLSSSSLIRAFARANCSFNGSSSVINALRVRFSSRRACSSSSFVMVLLSLFSSPLASLEET